MVLMPVLYLVVDTLALAPEGPEASITDPRLLVAAAIGYAVNVIYFTILEARSGQTLGKWIVGIRVAGLDLGRPGILRVILCNVLRIADAHGLMALLGVALIAFTRRRQRLGDLLAPTIVIQAVPEALPPAAPPRSRS